MRHPRMFEPRTPMDFIVIGVLIASAAWWSHVLRADIPVIAVVGG